MRTVTRLAGVLSSPVPSLRTLTAVELTLTGRASIATVGALAGSSPETLIPSSTLRSSGLFSGLWAPVAPDACAPAAPPGVALADPLGLDELQAVTRERDRAAAATIALGKERTLENLRSGSGSASL